MNTELRINIKESLLFRLVEDEARELSMKLQNKIYIIFRNNSLITTHVNEIGIVLSTYYLGNKLN